ncbi:MAG: alpha-2-macroglobulin [Pseudomonadota bacterium]
MARSGAVWATAGVLAAFAAGLLLGQNIDRGSADLRDSAGNSLVSPDVRRADDAPRRVFQEVRDEDAPRPDVAAPEGFAFDRLRLETQTKTPEACLQFTEALAADGSVNYADYIRLKPSAVPAVSVVGLSLCLSGLEFNKEYKTRLRAGLPAAGGATLERPVDVTIAFGDKPAYVGFAGEGVVLPRFEADGLGLQTVNVDAVEVSVRRVSDRSLARKRISSGGAVGQDDYYYVYGEEDGQDVGVEVFKDTIAVNAVANEATTTVFPLGAALPDLSPGAYFVRLRDVSPGADKRRPAQAWRWVMFTDLALTSYSSGEGIDVIVRSLENGRPRSGVDLQLIAENNDILASATTNPDGLARFEKASINGDYPLSPRIIMAYGPQEDFAALDLRRAPLDLSDRNIGGRSAGAVVDAYLYFDRGIYRPGETVRLSGLLRDAAGVAVDRPSTLIVTRPNGVEAYRTRLSDLSVGGFSLDYAVPRSAPRGVWSVRLEADGVGPVARETFSVEDFVPQRLDVAIDTDETTPLRADEERSVGVKARYLYGAPAGDLPVDGEARLRIDPNPFPEYSSFRFGPADKRFTERFIKLAKAKTNADGEATVNLSLADVNTKFAAPLRADLVVGVVEPGGRAVRESARLPVRGLDGYVGLRLANGGAGVGQDKPVDIEAVALDWRGALRTAPLEWRLVEEDYWFEWYRSGGQWRWRRSYKDVLIGEGRLQTSAEEPASLSQRLDPGSYRLTMVDPATKATTDLRFYVGWRSYEAGAAKPDEAELTLTSETVTPGARARLMIDPPYAGEAVVTIATDKVHLVKRMKVDAGGREIIVETDPAWGPGFYVMATIVTPRDAVDRPVPRRAMGVAYVPFDMGARTLNVSLGAPQMVRPRQSLDLPITVAGATRGDDIMVTVAAVDEGILRLTKFDSPDPVDFFFGKKRLGVEMRDDYGRILDPNLAAATNFGGDQIGGEGLSVVPIKSVSLFTGLVTLNDEGRAMAPIDIPDFNGELRLMAVAWSRDKLGAAAQPLTVRDPVPALLSLPRFLAPGDTADATLLIDNVEGAAGDYSVAIKGRGPIATDEVRTAALAEKAQVTDRLSFKAEEIGVGGVELAVSGPGDFSVSRDYSIEARSPFQPITKVSTQRLLAGESLSLSASAATGLYPGSAEVSVSFSPLRGVEPGPLLNALYRYPYGCSEQLTSAALPLLYADVLGAAAGRGPEYALRPRIQGAVNKLLDRQGPDGAFGLWRVGDAAATGWLGAYVTDFLARAANEGYGVPENALSLAYDALGKVARVDRWSYVNYRRAAYEGAWSNDTSDQLRKRSAAYALYVLARAGRADLSDLRYFHDAVMDTVKSPLAKAHIGAALAAMGDAARAESAFAKAEAAIGYDNTGDYYQSPLRDVAGVLALLSETGETRRATALSDRFVSYMRAPDRLHTQEKAYVLMAAQALLREAGATAVSVDGAPLQGEGATRNYTASMAGLDDGLTFVNDGEGPVFASVTAYGAPITAPTASASGYAITKRILTREGVAANLNAVRQNDRFVVVVSGESLEDRVNPSILVDLLPAGFEIESVLRPEDGARKDGAGAYPWLADISRLKIAEARDDRFVGAIDLTRQRFTVAYIARAVTPGDFALPGAVIEDMYRPGVAARTDANGRVRILPASE